VRHLRRGQRLSGPTGLRRLRWWALALVVVAFVASVKVWGLPFARDRLFVWVLLALAALSIGDLRGWLVGVLRDWAPLFLVLFAYDLLRGRADELTGRAHVDPHLSFDELLPGETPTLWLQDQLWSGVPHWYDYLAWVVYMSHFVVPLGVAVVLWRRAYPMFRAWVARLLALTFAGYLTYVAYPAVPPWLASRQGELAPSRRLITLVSRHMGIERAPSAISGEQLSNPVAALPSLHAAYPLLLCLFLWPHVGRVARVGLVGYVVAMGWVLVYGAEHFVFDLLLGWAYAVGVALLAARIARRRGRQARHVT
jgi:hypothetical protein